MGSSREPIDYTEKIKALQLDSEEAEQLRLELEARRNSAFSSTPGERKSSGPKDSGKGVRVQVRLVIGWDASSRAVFVQWVCLLHGSSHASPPIQMAPARPPHRADRAAACTTRRLASPATGESKVGPEQHVTSPATSHAPHASAPAEPNPSSQTPPFITRCRQKTLEAHVTCTHPKCAQSRMPYSFWCAAPARHCGGGGLRAPGLLHATCDMQQIVHRCARIQHHHPAPSTPLTATSASRTATARTPSARRPAAPGCAPHAAARAAPAACSAATAAPAGRR
jgi:hypothetical protein